MKFRISPPILILGSALIICVAMLWHHAGRNVPSSADDGSAKPRHSTSAPTGITRFSNLPETLKNLARPGNALQGSQAALAFIDHLSPTDFPSALEALRSTGVDSPGDLQALLLTAWAAKDPAAAAEYAVSQHGELGVVILSWSSRSPTDAMAWVEANVTGDDKIAPLLGTLLPALSEVGPEQMSFYLGNLSPNAKLEAIGDMAITLLKDGRGASDRWLKSLEGSEWHAEALKMVIKGSPTSDAVELLARYPDEVKAGEQGLNVFALFEGWEGRDGEAASAAFDRLPDGTAVHHDALQWYVSSGEVAADPSKGVAALDRFPGEVDEDIMASAVRNIMQRDPKAAAELALRSQRPNSNVVSVMSVWRKKDLPAAKAWLAEHPLELPYKEMLPKDLWDE